MDPHGSMSMKHAYIFHIFQLVFLPLHIVQRQGFLLIINFELRSRSMKENMNTLDKDIGVDNMKTNQKT